MYRACTVGKLSPTQPFPFYGIHARRARRRRLQHAFCTRPRLIVGQPRLCCSLSRPLALTVNHTTLHVNESGAASRQWNSDHFFLGAGDLERDALAGDLVGGDLAGVDLAGVDLVGAGDLERDALPLPVAGAMTFCVPPATTLYQSAAGSSQHSAMARMGVAASRLSIEPVLRMRSGKISVLRS